MDRIGDEADPTTGWTPPETACENCGTPVVGLVLLGRAIPMRFCPTCVDAEVAEREATERERVLAASLERAGETSRLRAYTLASHPGTDAVAVASRWLDGYRAGDRRNLYLSGPLGVGKTGLAWAIARALVEDAVDAYFALGEGYRVGGPRPAVLFVVWRDLIDDLRRNFDDHPELAEDPTRVLRRATDAPVLIVDDLGAGRQTPYAIEQLEILVDRRYHGRRPIVATSNLTLRELTKALGGEEGVLSGSRIASRLAEGALGYRFTGRSLRTSAA